MTTPLRRRVNHFQNLRGNPSAIQPRITAHAAAGDEQRLRILPAVGPVGGAIPGTRPDTNHRILDIHRGHPAY